MARLLWSGFPTLEFSIKKHGIRLEYEEIKVIVEEQVESENEEDIPVAIIGI